MKTATVKRTHHGPNTWDKWELSCHTQLPEFNNTVIRYFKTKREANAEKKKFLRSKVG